MTSTTSLDGPPRETHCERLDRFERKVGTTPDARSNLLDVEGLNHEGGYDPAINDDEGKFRGDPKCRHCIIFTSGSAREGVRDPPKYSDGRTPADVAAEMYDRHDGNGGIATTFSGP